jgi:hypothetical protein
VPNLYEGGKGEESHRCFSAEGRGVEDNTLLNRVIFALIALFFGVLALVCLMEGDPLTALQGASGSFMLHGAAAISAWRFIFGVREPRNGSLCVSDARSPLSD